MLRQEKRSATGSKEASFDLTGVNVLSLEQLLKSDDQFWVNCIWADAAEFELSDPDAAADFLLGLQAGVEDLLGHSVPAEKMNRLLRAIPATVDGLYALSQNSVLSGFTRFKESGIDLAELVRIWGQFCDEQFVIEFSQLAKDFDGGDVWNNNLYGLGRYPALDLWIDDGTFAQKFGAFLIRQGVVVLDSKDKVAEFFFRVKDESPFYEDVFFDRVARTYPENDTREGYWPFMSVNVQNACTYAQKRGLRLHSIPDFIQNIFHMDEDSDVPFETILDLGNRRLKIVLKTADPQFTVWEESKETGVFDKRIETFRP